MIRCFFGFHLWGRQTNIRDQKMDSGAAMLTPLFFMFLFLGPPKECDRTCLRCSKTKTFSYDSRLGR